MGADIFGVINVTPDSFSDGGEHLAVDDAVEHGLAMLAAGANVLDIGGESTRPGASPVAVEQECARVFPVIEGLAPAVVASGARLSIDTRHEEVALGAIERGATIINDVSASLATIAAEHDCGWVAMHMRGQPATMQENVHYDDVVAEVLAHLVEHAATGHGAGVSQLWIDPGIGFGKSHDDNWRILAALDRFISTDLPVLIGVSRKGFLGNLLGQSDGSADPTAPNDRLEGSVAVAVWALSLGVAAIRCHDVRDTAHARTIVGASRPDSIVALEVS